MACRAEDYLDAGSVNKLNRRVFVPPTGLASGASRRDPATGGVPRKNSARVFSLGKLAATERTSPDIPAAKPKMDPRA